MRSDSKGFSEVSAPLTAEAQELYDVSGSYTSTPPREPTFWLSEAAAEHSRTGSSGPARPLRGTRRLGSLLIANSVEQEVRCVRVGGGAAL